MESLIFSEDVCRLCLWRSNKLLHIYSDEGELQGIPMKIGMCLPISVSREDGLPHLICSRCIYKLEMFSEFRNSCVRSDQILKRYTLHGVPSTSQVPQLQPMLQTNIQPQLQVQQTHLPQMQNMQQTQFQQQTQIQHIQQIQQEQRQDIILETPESMKMEVIDASPVSIGQEAFMCIVPDQSITSPVSSSEREVQSFIPVIESVNTISTVGRSNDFSTSLPTNEPKETENKRVLRRTSSLKAASINSESSAGKGAHPQKESNKDKKGPGVTARRNIQKCKHCLKCFPSRLELGQHLKSSNCLDRYTCRYCAKVFIDMEKRIKHERNHQDKKSFMCRVCKSKFQSSFDLNVHLVHGCQNFTPGVKRPAMKPELRKPATIQEKNRVKVNGSTKVQEGLQTGTAKPKTQVPLKCKICNKVYSNGVNKQFNKHVQNCKRSLSMSKMHDIRRKLKLQKLVSVDKVPQTLAVNEQGRKKVCKVFSEDVKVRPLLRRKRKTVNVQALSTAETSLSANVEKSPKASLLHSLGLQEKQNQGLEIQNTSKPDEVMKNFRAAPEVINCDGDEVVTVCDICRKIFTSETGMLNHQMSVHNRNLTAEKMHSLMRVEI